MAKTAYSNYFQAELDVEQLIARHEQRATPTSDAALFVISDAMRRINSDDAVCASCGVTGATVVCSTRKGFPGYNIREAHFRFTNPTGADAHRPFCEFAFSKIKSPKHGEDINFQNARSSETRMVRKLVCTAIELGIFSQAEMREMRQWFYEIRESNRYMLGTDPAVFEYLMSLIRGFARAQEEFRPSLAELPGFDWKSAAQGEYVRRNLELAQQARTIPLAIVAEKSAGILASYGGADVFDVAALKPFYEMTTKLCNIVESSLGMVTTHSVRKLYKRPSALLAFSSMLLFVSEWDLTTAIAKLALILKSPPPKDDLSGNIIGLNPYHDYELWSILRRIDDLVAEFSPDLNPSTELEVIEAELKSKHQHWRAANPSLIGTNPA